MGQNWYCRAKGEAVFEVPKPGRVVGLGVDSMPESIRNSSILTGNDLGQLGLASTLPSNEEVQAFASDEGQRLDSDSAHHQAHKLLQEGNVIDAWKTLLTIELN
jgi:hypothetical protein